MKHIILIFICLFVISCSGGLIEEKDSESNDVTELGADGKSKYITSYYPNGQMEERGILKNNKREGTWESWFMDGVKKATTLYDSGQIIYDITQREMPKVIIEDSLRLGIPSNVKIINFFQGESISFSSNVLVEDSPEFDYYTYRITPLNTEPVIVYYYALEEIHLNQECEIELSDAIEVTASDLERTKIYKVDIIELQSLNVE